jgi:enoyl-[acyl-carrier protein] reductase I
LLLLNVEVEGQMEAVFDAIRARWGRLDFALHSIAFAPKTDLQGRVVDCSRADFHEAMDVSCYSFLQMARLAEPLMTDGGTAPKKWSRTTTSWAALEAVVRYLAAELGQRGARVHAISPGPLATRAASGIAHFDELLNRAARRAPAKRLVSIEDVGIACAALATDGARLITGDTLYVDGGLHVMD